MGKKSLTKNSIFYLGNQLLNILFPLFTGIYVARVLLPVDVGEVAYAQNIAQYFIILSFLGLPTYGLREISKLQNDKEQLNKIFSELYIINFGSTLLFLIIYVGMICTVEQFRSNIPVYLIVGGAIALNFLNISWLYEGLEEFQFVAIRNVIFKIFCIVLLIIFVRNQDDYLWYASITVVGTAGNYIVNIIVAPRYVTFTLRGLSLKRHLKPIMYLVAVNLAIEIYTLVDITMLGNMCEKNSVAFYSYGSKIYRILQTVVNSFTMVIVPRLTLYYKEKKINEYNQLISKTLNIIIILALPMIIGLQFVAGDVVTVLYGAAYENSTIVLKILSVLLFVSPIGYLLGSRVMLVTGQENKMLISVGIGAIFNVIGNYILIQQFAEFGAAIASVISGIIVMIVYVSFGWKYFKLTGIIPSIIKVFLASMGMTVLLLIVSQLQINIYLKLTVEIVAAISIYLGILLLTKESIVSEYTVRYLRIINRRR